VAIQNAIIPLDSLLPDLTNPKKHNPENIRKLVSRIQAVGFTSPVLVAERTGILKAGHRRRLALLWLRDQGFSEPAGIEPGWGVPARIGEWSELQELQVLIGDNEDPQEIEFDPVNLTDLLAQLQAQGGLEGAGYDAARLDQLIAEVAGYQEPGEGGFGEGMGNGAGEDGPGPEVLRQSLSERFGVPPFSVLDARQGYWQTRKRAWLALGIQSETGRGENLLKFPETVLNGRGGAGKGLARSTGQDLMRGEHTVGETHPPEEGWQPTGLTFASGTPHPAEVSLKLQETSSGTSIFDPVLCELAYRWFCPPGGAVLDPFAGGSVRGIVASRLGYRYTGVDLSGRQLEANREQAAVICPDRVPNWIEGDSSQIEALAPGEYDLVFSCPPYADLEVYSEDERDLSTMEYERFREAYRWIILSAVRKLRDNRFACFVVGDVRDKKGFYRNFVADTIQAFQDAGAQLYNDAILVTAACFLPMRVGKQFGQYRKLGKTHQNVLVFYKGDPKQIPTVLGGDCQFGELEEADAPAVNLEGVTFDE
jgi:hypothetical protein